MTGARVLLAGATGTLGRALIPALGDAGYRVIALARPKGRPLLAPFGHRLEDIREAQATQPETLAGLCDGVDIVLSTLGITRQRDGLTPDAVDYSANLGLLREAERAGVRHFAYVSVIGADRPGGVPVIAAKRRFEEALRSGQLSWTIYRPSGFFTDLLDLLAMARRRRVWLIGPGKARITPIDVGDLAGWIATNLERRGAVLEAGGPEDWDWNDLARACFEALGRRARVSHLPVGLVRTLQCAVRPLSPSTSAALSFLVHVQTQDSTAAKVGTTTLRSFLAQAAGQRVPNL